MRCKRPQLRSSGLQLRRRIARAPPYGPQPGENSSAGILHQEQIASPVSFGNRGASVSSPTAAASPAANKLGAVNRRELAEAKTKSFVFGLCQRKENVPGEEELVLHKDKQT